MHDEAKPLEVNLELFTGGKCFLTCAKVVCCVIDEKGLVEAEGGSFGVDGVGLLSNE